MAAKGIFGIVILGCVVALAAFSPWLAPFDPNDQDILGSLLHPLARGEDGRLHLLGTDRLGQDVLSRVVYGSRVSLVVGIGAVGAAMAIGVPIGLAAGFLGRWAEALALVASDIVLSIPFVLLALVLMSVLGASLVNLIIAFAAVRWAQFARITYALSLELREKEYVLTCKAAGIGMTRTLVVHVLPNMVGPLLVVATLELAYAILMEAGLSFLGLGAPPETPSWGGMLQEGRNDLDIAWWLTTAPGLAIMLTAIGYNFVGDWLRDRLDPRLQGLLR
ncbi:MAG: ABC transporter permease [Alphaproteobacteria bacterium]|nr:ABC transporter permease [Alphaproteobacteria bacterium]